MTNLAIPAAVYISKDESEEEASNKPDFVLDCCAMLIDTHCQFNKIISALSEKQFAAKNDHKLYSSMYVLLPSYICISQLVTRFHGWAAARANLKDEENKKQCVS
jgi:hypothetical protein